MNVLEKIKNREIDVRRSSIESRVIGYYGENSYGHLKVMLACDMSCDTLRGGKRRDGSPLIAHEREMFIIAFDVLNIRDVNLLVAIFMHDMNEDYAGKWPLWRIWRLFGWRVTLLVWSVTKPERKYAVSDKVYNFLVFSKVWLGGYWSKVLKCIDREDNMLTLYGDEEKQVKKILQTLKYVLPISLSCNILTAELVIAIASQAEKLGLDHDLITKMSMHI